MKIRRAALPAGHPDIGRALYRMSGVFNLPGQRDEAARLLQEALAIYRAALPAEHPWIGEAEAALAEVRPAADSQL